MSYHDIKFSKTRNVGFELSSEDEARLKELQEHLEKDQIQYLWVTGKATGENNDQLIGIYVPIVKTLYSPSSIDSDRAYGYTAIGKTKMLLEL
jgi:hypothetical protein